MLLMILGAAFSLLVPVLIYRHILKGKEGVDKKLYRKTFLLAATLYTLPIIILGITWDSVVGAPPETFSITDSLLFSFVRAAMIEEAVKYFFAYRVLKRNQALGMKESILLAGLVGIGYGFTEKLAYFNPVASILNGLLPGHMLFQWIMGYYLYKAFHVENAQRRKYQILAFVVPFLVHGFWDFGMDSLDFVETSSVVLQGIMVGVTIVLMILMLVAIIVGTKKVRNIKE